MSTATVSPKAAAQHELYITRVFDAPRELVWRVWTDPEHMKHWAGPRQFEARDIENDPRPGGKWRLCLHTDGFDVGDGELKKFDLRQGGENLEVVEPGLQARCLSSAPKRTGMRAPSLIDVDVSVK